MKHWNGTPTRVRVSPVDPRLVAMAGVEMSRYCVICDRLLPRGLGRVYCLEHSEYPQRLQRQLKQEC